MIAHNMAAVSNSKPTQGDIKQDETAEAQVDDDHNAAVCGIGQFQPKLLKMAATMPVFVGVYSISAVTTSTLTAYVNSQVTTLERHFGFSSSQTGLIMAANDVGFLVLILFVSFLTTRFHIPRALGFFTILFGVAGILCALPQFLFGAPSPVTSGSAGTSNSSTMASSRPSGGSFSGQLCEAVNHTFDCDVLMEESKQPMQGRKEESTARANSGTALSIIVVGMVLQGLSKSPRSTFTTFYVDSNVPKVNTGFYMGIIMAAGILGPTLAFALGSVFARVYVTLEDTDLHFRHPKWIGAWWLGYLTFGCAACVLALPLFCFPRHLRKRKRQEESDYHQQQQHTDSLTVFKFVKGFISALYRLCVNPVYICIVLAACSTIFTVAGGQSFMAKYTENTFALPVWEANLTMAGVTLITACVGTFVGGYLTKRWKMGSMTNLKYIIIMNASCAAISCFLLLFKCPQPHIYNSPGPLASEDTSLQGCLGNCTCDDGDYFPVCGDDGRTFFSPCHAGCQVTVKGKYTNCTCIEGGTAMGGTCDYGCDMFYPFVVTYCLIALTNTLAIIPTLLVYIRAIELRDKPLGIGLASFLTSITGWMLAPICFGKWIDGVCIQWEESCRGRGSCLLYDNDEFRVKLLGYQVVFRVLALGFVVLAYIAARITKVFEKSHEKVETNGITIPEQGELGEQSAEQQEAVAVAAC